MKNENHVDLSAITDGLAQLIEQMQAAQDAQMDVIRGDLPDSYWDDPRTATDNVYTRHACLMGACKQCTDVLQALRQHTA